MENRLETEFNEILKNETVTDCVLADAQGLCLLSSSNLKGEIAGLVAAISQHAALIEPSSGSMPIVFLESDTRQCLIQNEGGVTTALFQKTQNS